MNYTPSEIYPLDFARVPKIGASIGAAGTGLAGSIGLFIKVNGHNYAITCQHVVTRPEDASNKVDRIEILQPGQHDLDKEEALLDETIKAAQLECEMYDDAKLKADTDTGPAITKGQKVHVEQNRELEKKCSDRKAKMTEVRLPFGVVEAFPGKSKHGVYNCLRDWAFQTRGSKSFQPTL